jgi:hypothetical protein
MDSGGDIDILQDGLEEISLLFHHPRLVSAPPLAPVKAPMTMPRREGSDNGGGGLWFSISIAWLLSML